MGAKLAVTQLVMSVWELAPKPGAVSVVVRRDVVADPVAGDVGLELAQRGNRVGAGESADRHHRGVGGQLQPGRRR